jgi:DNA polymerase V
LHGKPVVVLSNNDGCIVSRTDEAKALGIRMAGPYYQNKQEMKQLMALPLNKLAVMSLVI